MAAAAVHRRLNIGRFRRAATAWLARFLERHYVFFNFVSNPLIDLGILFELLLCYFFFYTPLAEIYYFAPVPWHVYLFACHGTVVLLAFEETKKYYRRKGFPWNFSARAERRLCRCGKVAMQNVFTAAKRAWTIHLCENCQLQRRQCGATRIKLKST